MGVDYSKEPSEDYAQASIVFEDEEGRRVIGETTTSWSFVGAGLRHTIELLGPEYSMRLNTLDTGLEVFLSRRVVGETGEDLVEKQNAEQGLMPVVPDEAAHYGYVAENRHMVRAFLDGTRPEIAFEDFAKIDLRTATILEAERVPKTDKLIRLTVDLGFEHRQIIAGIAEHCAPEDLLGKRIVVVANLAPRKLRGLMSEGMLLAARSDDNFFLLQPSGEAAPGAEIS